MTATNFDAPTPGLGVETAHQVTVVAVHKNLNVNVISVTEDKARLCLMRTTDRLAAADAWQTPFGVLLTIVLTLITTDFKDALYVPAATWRAIFLIALAASIVWTVQAARSAFNAPTVDRVIEDLKAGQPAEEQS